jgi:two-component system response regulator HydG
MLRKIFNGCLKLITSRFTFFRSVENYVSDKTILLVDDDPDFCRLIRRTLEKKGFKVVVAYTFTSAKQKLDIYNLYIIIMNQNLPDGTGTEFLEKNKPRLENKLVIIVTSDSSSALSENLKVSGVVDFVSKPFNPAVLSKMVYLAVNF